MSQTCILQNIEQRILEIHAISNSDLPVPYQKSIHLPSHKTRPLFPQSTARKTISSLPFLGFPGSLPFNLEVQMPLECQTNQRLIKKTTSSLCSDHPSLPLLSQQHPHLTYCCSAHFQSHWQQTCLYGHLALEQKARKKDTLQAILGACNMKSIQQRKKLQETLKQVA